MKKTILQIVFSFWIVVVGQSYLLAQSPTPAPSPTPTEAELKLAEEIRLLELQKKKAELQKDIRETAPTPSITPLSGSVSFTESDKLSMEISMQSYSALRSVSDNIACDIRKAVPNDDFTVVLYRQDDYSAWRNFNLISPTLISQINGMKEEYQAWLTRTTVVDFRSAAQKSANSNLAKTINIAGTPPSAGTESGGSPSGAAFTTVATTALAGASTTVKMFAELMSLFRSDITYTSKAVSIDGEALKSTVINSLKAKTTGCTNTKVASVFDPTNFSPSENGSAFTSPVLTDINELIELQRAANIAVSLFEVAEADIKLIGPLEQKLETIKAQKRIKDAEVKGLTALLAATPPNKKLEISVNLEKAKAEQNNLVADEMNATTTLSEFRRKISPYEDQVSVSNRVRVSRLKELNDELNNFLKAFVAPVSGGASLLSQYVKAEKLDESLKKNQVYWLRVNAVEAGGNTRTIKNLLRYFYRPDVKHSGGAIIEFSLSDKNGKILVSNTSSFYEKYKDAKDMR